MIRLTFLLSFLFIASHLGAQTPSNTGLTALLDTVYNEDQSGRIKIDSLQRKFGWKSQEVQSLLKTIAVRDSLNLIRVKNVLNKHGWPGPDEVGKRGSQAIFLVIQHADSTTQATYLPVMREAVRKGKAQASSLALLEDRVLVDQGKKQIYGSQVRTDDNGKNEFFPIKDEANVNKRRVSVGLGPIEEYAKYFDIIYVFPRKKNTK